MPRSEASKEQMRQYDRLRSKDPKRRAQQAAWFRNERATNPEFKQKAYAATAKWIDEHKDDNNAYRTAWAKTDREKHLEVYRAHEFRREMKKYSTTIEWYRDKLIEQSGLCAVCGHLNHSGRGELHRLQVDHDHSCCDLKTKSCGKCLRGLLCETCNINLSYLEKFYNECAEIAPNEDSWTYHALRYLDKFSSKSCSPLGLEPM